MSLSVSPLSPTTAGIGRIAAVGRPMEVVNVAGASATAMTSMGTPVVPWLTGWQPQVLWSAEVAMRRFATGIRLVHTLCRETDHHLAQLLPALQRTQDPVQTVRAWVNTGRMMEGHLAHGWRMAIDNQLPAHRPFFRQLRAEATVGLRVVNAHLHSLRHALAGWSSDPKLVGNIVEALGRELDPVHYTRHGIKYTMGPSRARYAHLLLTSLERASWQHTSDSRGVIFFLPYTAEPEALFEEIDATWPPMADPDADPYLAGLIKILGWKMDLADGPGHWVATIDFAS